MIFHTVYRVCSVAQTLSTRTPRSTTKIELRQSSTRCEILVSHAIVRMQLFIKLYGALHQRPFQMPDRLAPCFHSVKRQQRSPCTLHTAAATLSTLLVEHISNGARQHAHQPRPARALNCRVHWLLRYPTECWQRNTARQTGCAISSTSNLNELTRQPRRIGRRAPSTRC